MFKLIFLLPAALLFIVGTLIYKYKMVDMIAGYDPRKVKDKDGLAKWVGGNLQGMGMLTLLITLLSLVFESMSMPVLTVSFLVIITILCINTAIGTKKFEVNE